MPRYDTETQCHCGSPYRGSDHCPECGCEQYESGDCGHTSEPCGWCRQHGCDLDCDPSFKEDC